MAYTLSLTSGDAGDTIPTIDLRFLTQSELYDLSQTSAAAAAANSNPNPNSEIVIPKIDKSVFNESAGSRKQTYSRLRLAPPSSSSRAPHLRHVSPSYTQTYTDDFDPEDIENDRIVTLIKTLFASNEANSSGLVPVRVDYDTNTLGKRKRNDNVNEMEIESPVEVSVVVDVVDENVDVFRYNVEEMEREVLNKDGVAVDLVALGTVEHPYAEEITRRSEMYGSEEELLVFLKGLDGIWGSRRKKKRIVDASGFGDSLPVGWKLLLSVKKKTGHAWLYCRRYISPSGRQFVSCKEVSSYLLSLHGIKDTSQCASAPHGETGAADKLTSSSIADSAMPDVERKDNLVLPTPSPAVAATSGNHVVVPGDLPKERLGETLHCKKCNITFSEKDELLQHKSSVHKKTRSKNGVKITDGVIIKDGKYECQFCHKTFDERHRYNGHVGAHVRYQKISGEPLQTVGGGDSLGVQDTNLTKQSDNVPEICSASISNGLNSFSPSYDDNEQVGDLREGNGNVRGTDVASDIVNSTSPCSAAEANISSKENKSSHNETDGNMNGVVEVSASVENPKQDMVTESSLFNSTMEACVHNQLKDGENISANESMFDFISSCEPLDNDVAVGVKQARNFEDIHCKIFGTSDNTLTSASMESEVNLESNVSLMGRPEDEKARAEVGEYTFDEIYSFETPSEKVSSKADNISISRQEEIHFGIGSRIPSWSEQNNVPRNVNIEPDRELGVCSNFASDSGKQFFTEENVFNSALEEHTQQPSMTSSVLLGESGVSQVPDEAYGVNNKAYGTSKISEIANAGKHDELSLSFGDFQTELLPNSNRDLNIINSNLKQGTPFGIDFGHSSSNNRTHELDSSFNISHPVSEWNGPTRANTTTSAQKFMVDYANTGDNLIADGSWGIGQANVFQGSFDATASSQPLNCFDTFDLTSYKGEEGAFGVNNNYNIRSDMLRPNRSEPVEYSFMGNGSSNSLSGGSKILSDNANMEGGLDTSIWQGNTVDRNQSTCVCVWCRNVFYQDQATQTVGAIGSLCPSCSTRIPGQFNVL